MQAAWRTRQPVTRCVPLTHHAHLSTTACVSLQTQMRDWVASQSRCELQSPIVSALNSFASTSWSKPLVLSESHNSHLCNVGNIGLLKGEIKELKIQHCYTNDRIGQIPTICLCSPWSCRESAEWLTLSLSHVAHPQFYIYLLACVLGHFSCVQLFLKDYHVYLMDCSPPGSSVHGISQARILE